MISSRLLGLEPLEAVDLDVLDEGVELLLGLLILIPLSRDAHAHLAGHIPDACRPNLPIEQRVNAHLLHISSMH